MKATEQGRVTPEMLDELARWAGKPDRKPWSMGVSSHVVRALVDEVREHRDQVGARDTEPGAGDVEALAATLWLLVCHGDPTWNFNALPEYAADEHREQARAILASDWLAAHDAEVARTEQERHAETTRRLEQLRDRVAYLHDMYAAPPNDPRCCSDCAAIDISGELRRALADG